MSLCCENKCCHNGNRKMFSNKIKRSTTCICRMKSGKGTRTKVCRNKLIDVLGFCASCWESSCVILSQLNFQPFFFIWELSKSWWYLGAEAKKLEVPRGDQTLFAPSNPFKTCSTHFELMPSISSAEQNLQKIMEYEAGEEQCKRVFFNSGIERLYRANHVVNHNSKSARKASTSGLQQCKES